VPRPDSRTAIAENIAPRRTPDRPESTRRSSCPRGWELDTPADGRALVLASPTPRQANALSPPGNIRRSKKYGGPGYFGGLTRADPPAPSPATNSSPRRLRERDHRGSSGQAEMRPAGPADGTDQASRPGHQPGHSRTRQRRDLAAARRPAPCGPPASRRGGREREPFVSLSVSCAITTVRP
jgi:hypothetical protein